MVRESAQANCIAINFESEASQINFFRIQTGNN